MTCAHPGCKCSVTMASPWGNYCSESCQKAANEVETRCQCGHPNCQH